MVLQLGSLERSRDTLFPENTKLERLKTVLLQESSARYSKNPLAIRFNEISDTDELVILCSCPTTTSDANSDESEAVIHLRIVSSSIQLAHSLCFEHPSYTHAALTEDCNSFNKCNFVLKAAVNSPQTSRGPHTALVTSTISIDHGCSYSMLFFRLRHFLIALKDTVYPFFK